MSESIELRLSSIEAQISHLLQSRSYTLPTKHAKHTKKINGYLLFSSKMRTEALSQLHAHGATYSNSNVLSELATMWNLLTPDERSHWNSIAFNL